MICERGLRGVGRSEREIEKEFRRKLISPRKEEMSFSEDSGSFSRDLPAATKIEKTWFWTFKVD